MYIGECIRSALSQDYANLEIIVVDDGSTDGSWQKIQEFGDQIIAVRMENQGQLKALFAGLSLAQGDYIYFLDADDVLAEDALAQIAPCLQPDVSKIQFMLLPIDKDGNAIGNAFPTLRPSDDSTALIRSIRTRGYYNTPPTSGNIYRRDVYEGLGDMSYEMGIDGVPYLLAPFVGRVVSIDRTLGKYRIHDSNQSSFSVVTSTRMKRYVDCFMGRLHHLAELVQARCATTEKFEVRNDYAYVMELDAMSRVADGKQPGIRQTWAHIAAVAREHTGRKRLGLCLFAVALFVLPNSMARQLTAIRVNPSRSGHFRSRLKQAFSV
ncbi:glycosyltransferase family 2 protein [Rhizobiaceae bacterium n13]|uniref:Glycosyltransferase family 2 protein n=2 Tax=Ferirhizobium litorale TaxID=2927786 RepID=A0AAE3QIY9_9HYPH|nr:glycosyltransferase family 2 protein [Fererhizobium litorale]MDI7924049.1 glycosyltransferase family 2 protein [Fererhizobium litorale]